MVVKGQPMGVSSVERSGLIQSGAFDPTKMMGSGAVEVSKKGKPFGKGLPSLMT